MSYLPLALLKHCRDRLHTPAAVCRSIPREYIDVKTPKTLRTVIGVSVSDNGCATVLAHKVLDTFLKSFWMHIFRSIKEEFLRQKQEESRAAQRRNANLDKI